MMMVKHLHQRPADGKCFYRRRVPKALQPRIGRIWIVESLGAKDLAEVACRVIKRASDDD